MSEDGKKCSSQLPRTKCVILNVLFLSDQQDTEFTQIQFTTMWDKEKQERQKETANSLTDGNIL